jgi:arylsulfatase
MKRNLKFCRVFLLCVFVSCSADGTKQKASPSPSKNSKPNIVLIMADDLGWAELGSYGQKKIRTPNLDRLAKQGIRFTDFYTGAPVCAPARCNLMTGKHGGHASIRDNVEVGPWKSYRGQKPLPKEELTLAEFLKRQGYRCGAFGKWGLGEVGSSGDPLSQGFDRFFGYNCQRHAHNLYPRYLIDNRKKLMLKGNRRGLTGAQYSPQLIADQALRFVQENKNHPFFLYYPTVIPHLPLQAPEKDVAKYDFPETPYRGSSYLKNNRPRATYAAMISFMDSQVGRLLKLLDRLHLTDNTIVIFCSDNGTTYLKKQVDYDFFKSVGPLRGFKGSLYEGGIRVPLIVKWPGHLPEGEVLRRPTALYDIFASVGHVLGKDVHNDGLSFLPAPGEKLSDLPKHSFLLFDFNGYGRQLAVRMGRWKAIKRGLRKNPNAAWELFDLETDIGEKHNVAKDHPEILKQVDAIVRQEKR